MADRFRSFVARAPSSIASDIGTPKKRPSWWRPEGDRPRVRYRGQVQRYHTWQVNGGVDSQFFTQIEDKAASLVQDAGISAPGLDLFEIRLYAVAGEKSLEVSHPTVVVQNFNEVQLRKRAVKLLKDKLVKYPEYKGLRVSHWSTRDLPYGWTEQNECRVYSTPSFDVVYGPADASRALSSATVGLTVRIPLCSDSGKRSQQQNGTIAATVRLPGRQSLYYLAPAHIFLPGVFREHDNAEPDDEVDFDDFLDDEEPEITSRGSTSPPPSIFSNSRMNSSVTSLQSGASASSEDTLTFQQYDVDEEDGTGSPTPRAEETHRPPLELSPDQFEGCVMVSMALDYVLIETPEGADSLSLSEINGDTVGDIDAISDFNGIEVHLITLRAGAIQGRLLNSPALMVLPGSSQFQRLYPVILDQGSLQLGDSGAIVKDNATGKLYGHVVAGNPDTLFGDHGHVSIAYIVPSTRVLADIEARIGGLSTSVPETPQAVPEATVPEKKAGGKKNRYDIQLSLNWDITERLPPRTRNNYSGRSRRRFRHGRGESTPASERSVTRPSSRAHHMQRPRSGCNIRAMQPRPPELWPDRPGKQ
ncbi:hypothetical protein QBC34DRAFT_374250 [Podospora aff. communis PSN243]|uniref:Uncharacterized protein n=1 Tax=Podospora aff. communis PSN243 TaxID=3040156 RepID=A0AAV9H7H5_9PEZI|nr:hypothetical protein QBC34DRAFT_374250 [Podospora aff. communis PSN243]